MRRLTEDMKRVVEEQRLAFAATVGADGTANLSPKGTIAVLDDEHLMFADLASPRRLALTSATARRTVGTTYASGLLIRSTNIMFMRLWPYGTRDRSIARPTERIHHIVVIELERCLPLISPAYDSGATEAEVSERWEDYFTRLWGERRAGRSAFE